MVASNLIKFRNAVQGLFGNARLVGLATDVEFVCPLNQ